MSCQYFLTTSSVQVSPRWSAAFGNGVACGRSEIVTRALRGDVVWVSTIGPRWRDDIASVVAELPGCPVVAVSLAPRADEGLAALSIGARGYCHALAASELFRDVADVVRRGGLWIGAELMGRLIGAVSQELPPPEPALAALLSPREIEVACLAADGASNREIAEKLGITERTVKAHMGAVFEKLGVRDRLQLVLRLHRQAVPLRGG